MGSALRHNESQSQAVKRIVTAIAKSASFGYIAIADIIVEKIDAFVGRWRIQQQAGANDGLRLSRITIRKRLAHIQG
jgi:hypothetical protein